MFIIIRLLFLLFLFLQILQMNCPSLLCISFLLSEQKRSIFIKTIAYCLNRNGNYEAHFHVCLLGGGVRSTFLNYGTLPNHSAVGLSREKAGLVLDTSRLKSMHVRTEKASLSTDNQGTQNVKCHTLMARLFPQSF